MSDTTRLNAFMKSASRADVDNVVSGIILSERQQSVFRLYFIKRKDVNFISDILCVNPRVISREIHETRRKILACLSKKETLQEPAASAHI